MDRGGSGPNLDARCGRRCGLRERERDKDKSLLLSSILNELGIEAFPALVNTEAQTELARELPSPLAFDHCIVLGFVGAGHRAGMDAGRRKRLALDRLRAG